MKNFSPLRLICLLAFLPLAGCPDDETMAPPSSGFNVSSTQLSAGAGTMGMATISGGTAPYSIKSGPDPAIATASISGSTLTVTGVAGGYTSLVVQDAADDSIRVGVSVSGAITYPVFPLTIGNQYVYDGYAINTTVNGSTILPDPNNVYRASWTIAPSPIPGTTAILDTTTLDVGVVVTASRTLIIRQDGTGRFEFLQTLGPFFRAFAILPLGRMDTTRWIPVADPSVGIGGTWTAFDSTYTNAVANSVRLEIVGNLEAGETISDSSETPILHDVIRFRTHRNIFLDGTLVVSNFTTARLWLQKDVGPIQVHIAEDTENLGHFRTLQERNF